MPNYALTIKASYIDKDGLSTNERRNIYLVRGDNAEEIAKKRLRDWYESFIDKLGEMERADDINSKAVLIQNECNEDHTYARILFKEFAMCNLEGRCYEERYAHTIIDYTVYPISTENYSYNSISIPMM